MTPFTPGDWKSGRFNRTTQVTGFCLVEPQDGPPIAYVSSPDDARLMAESKRVLEALKQSNVLLMRAWAQLKVAHGLAYKSVCLEDMEEQANRNQDLIAKAEGR